MDRWEAEWKDIEDAPKVEGKHLLGYDEISAERFGDPEAGLCIIRWEDGDSEDGDSYPSGWVVQPFAEDLDFVLSETRITKWMSLPGPPKKFIQ